MAKLIMCRKRVNSAEVVLEIVMLVKMERTMRIKAMEIIQRAIAKKIFSVIIVSTMAT